MSDDWLIMRPGERIRGGRKPPFKKVSVSSSKKKLLKDLSRQHPRWTAGQYIDHARKQGVTLTPDEVWSTLYPG